jgi:hypothetical protein
MKLAIFILLLEIGMNAVTALLYLVDPLWSYHIFTFLEGRMLFSSPLPVSHLIAIGTYPC